MTESTSKEPLVSLSKVENSYVGVLKRDNYVRVLKGRFIHNEKMTPGFPYFYSVLREGTDSHKKEMGKRGQ